MSKKSILVIPIFVPHAGCPHDCVFCNQKIISGQTKLPTSEDVITEIEKFRPAAFRYDEVELAFYGGSFTAIPAEDQEMFLRTVQPFLKKNGGFIDTLRASTRPDCIDDSVIERLKKYNLTIVELGAQSMDDDVLRLSERGHTSLDTMRATEKLHKAGIVVGIQTMTGLPGATPESDIKTAEKVCDLQPEMVRIYPTIVINHTKLCKMFMDGDYHTQTIEDCVQLCANLYNIYNAHDIPVARIGLQSSDNISENGEIAGGPYHPSFGQLVQTELIYRRIVAGLADIDSSVIASSTLLIYVRKGAVSDCIGQKRSNIAKLQKELGVKAIKVIGEAREEALAQTTVSFSKNTEECPTISIRL